MLTRYITIRFQVTADISGADLHEDICQVFHEDQSPTDKIMNGLIDVEIMDETEPTEYTAT